MRSFQVTRWASAAARAAAIAAALNVAVATAPARAASPSPFEVVDVGPLPVPTSGQATVRLRLHGGEVASSANLALSASRVAVPRISGTTVSIRDVRVEGVGGRIESTIDSFPQGIPASAGRAVPDQLCVRGGYAFSSWPRGEYENATVVVEANATVDVVATLHVPAGFHGVPAIITVHSSELRPYVDSYSAVKAPWAESIVLPLPRVGPASDVISLTLSGRSGKRVRLRGRVAPAREGVAVEIAGRRTPNTAFGEVLGNEQIATAPIGPRMRRFGEATTDATGRWSAWLTLPPRVAVVARTAAEPDVTLGGASCGLWFSSPKLDLRAAEAKR